MQKAYASATPAERSFWLWWVLATTIGSVVGWTLAGAVVLGAERRFDDVTSPLIGAVAMAVTEAVAFGILGAAFGTAQWIALRRHLASSGWWVVATTGGWAIAGIVGGVLIGALGGVVTGVGPDAGFGGFAVAAVGNGAALGLLPGLSQWLVLRGQVGRSGHWVVSQFVSFGAGYSLAFPVMVAIAWAMGWNLLSAEAWALMGALGGTIYGVSTGAALMRLLNRRVQPLVAAQTGGIL